MTSILKSLINALSLVLCVCAVDVARANKWRCRYSFREPSSSHSEWPVQSSADPVRWQQHDRNCYRDFELYRTFTPDMTACLHTPFPAAITDGVFTWTFDDGDTLDGTWSGLIPG